MHFTESIFYAGHWEELVFCTIDEEHRFRTGEGSNVGIIEILAKTGDAIRKTAILLSSESPGKLSVRSNHPTDGSTRLKRPNGAGPGRRRTGVAVQPRHADGFPRPLIQSALEKIRQVQVGQQGRPRLYPAPKAGQRL